MFIRFVSSHVDERSHVTAGLFCAAYKLRRSEYLPDYEFAALTELREWFDVHLNSPFDRLRRHRRELAVGHPLSTDEEVERRQPFAQQHATDPEAQR